MNIIAEKILKWYAINKRAMPWRDVKDPYKVWISEVMLQQTRVDTVAAYYQRWMTRFPDTRSLAMADQEEVLKIWEGLGYYTRARKLHEAAKIVVNQHDGVFPSDIDTLLALPGIGAYTAAAIASFAFDKDTFPVDGNINRVFSRVFYIQDLLGSHEFNARIEQHRLEIFPSGRSADFNQALMDLGAMVCKPTSPMCIQCPLKDECRGRAVAESLPRKAPKKAVPIVKKAALTLIMEGRVLVRKRPVDGLLGGLWEFPTIDIEDELRAVDLAKKLQKTFGLEIAEQCLITTVKHAYTHFKVIEQVYWHELKTPSKIEIEGVWVEKQKLLELPMGKIDRSIATKLLNI